MDLLPLLKLLDTILVFDVKKNYQVQNHYKVHRKSCFSADEILLRKSFSVMVFEAESVLDWEVTCREHLAVEPFNEFTILAVYDQNIFFFKNFC